MEHTISLGSKSDITGEQKRYRTISLGKSEALEHSNLRNTDTCINIPHINDTARHSINRPERLHIAHFTPPTSHHQSPPLSPPPSVSLIAIVPAPSSCPYTSPDRMVKSHSGMNFVYDVDIASWTSSPGGRKRDREPGICNPLERGTLDCNIALLRAVTPDPSPRGMNCAV